MNTTKRYSGTITVSGKEYGVSVKDGIRYVGNLTIDEFMDTLTPQEIMSMAIVGKQAVKNEKKGTTPFKLQDMANDIHSANNN